MAEAAYGDEDDEGDAPNINIDGSRGENQDPN